MNYLFSLKINLLKPANAGIHTVKVNAEGYNPITTDELTVKTGQINKQDIKLTEL